jgi:hypothetical protein
MYTKIEFRNNAATPVTLTLNNDMYPINEFEWEHDVRTSRRNKMQKTGSWPGMPYVGAALGHMRGEILAPDSSTFNTRKLALINAIFPNPTVQPTNYELGTLTLRLDGMSEDVSTLVGIDGDISIPSEGLSPARSPLQITWVAYAGYFTGVTSGNPYWIK